MARTGSTSSLGTAEGALFGRARHTLHAQPPVLDDPWAIELLSPELRERVRDSSFQAGPGEIADIDFAPILALNIGNLRYAEDAVLDAVEIGASQYLVLGAGFDTFALRRADLRDRLTVYEVDHPDVQALKRARIDASPRTPDARPHFVPVDFETSSLENALAETPFDRRARSVASWMNTIPYLSEQAVGDTLAQLARWVAPGSRLALDYTSAVPLREEQIGYIQSLVRLTQASGEPLRSRFAPEDFATLLAGAGWRVVEEIDELELARRYFRQRADGLRPLLPARLVLAERPDRSG